MGDSPFAKLPLHGRAVDKRAAVVGFYRGEHFEPSFDTDRPPRKRTMHLPPRPVPLPEGCFDYTGQRRGRMVAISYYRQSANKQYAIWVCRCSCGRYEFRKPARWRRKVKPDDMCDECVRVAEVLQGGPGKSARTRQHRLKAFINRLLRLGLTGEEVAAVLDADMTVEGLSAADIRLVLKVKL